MISARQFRNLTFLLIGMLPLQACSSHYSAQAIEGWIVDADTKQALRDVNVVAHWELKYGLEGGGSYQLQIMEAVTDQNGRFYFPAWGPKEIPKHLPSEARLKDADPEIIIFKSGYKVFGARNANFTYLSGHGPSVRNSELNGKTIPLKKFVGGKDAIAANVASSMSSLHFLGVTAQNCEWKFVPRMIVALTKEVKALNEQGIDSPFFYVRSIENLPRQADCGSAREFFREYIK